MHLKGPAMILVEGKREEQMTSADAFPERRLSEKKRRL
jgi:hypothetical protein